METHLKVTAVLFILMGVVLIFLAVLMSLVFSVVGGVVGASGEEDAVVALAALGLTGVALTIFLLVMSVPYIICGWGLWKRRSWARIMGIVLAILALLEFPIGTAFGVYALIILFKGETEKLFS
jgi:hypothetical protein